MQQSERADKLAELWEKYFASPKKDKDAIMQEYNVLAKEYNSIRGFNCMTIITNQTKDSAKIAPLAVVNQPKEPEVKQSRKPGSIIEQIIELYKSGKTNKEIIEMGFNKSTVGRQVSEYKKKQK